MCLATHGYFAVHVVIFSGPETCGLSELGFVFVEFFEASILFKEIFFIPDDLISFNTKAKLECFPHLCVLELLTYLADILVCLSVFVVFKVDSNCFFVLADICVKSCQFYPIFDLFFDFTDDLKSSCFSFLLRKSNLQTLFNLFGIHRSLGNRESSFI